MKFKPGDRARIVKAALKPQYVGTECVIDGPWDSFYEGEWYWVITHDGQRVVGPDYSFEPISPAREWFDKNIQIPKPIKKLSEAELMAFAVNVMEKQNEALRHDPY